MEGEQMTKEQAKALYESGWWEGLPAEKVARFQLTTKRLCMPFGEFHKAVEEAIGRPVWTHEFVDADQLLAEMDGEIESPDDPNQHALDSMAALLVSEGRDPDEVMIAVRTDRSDA